MISWTMTAKRDAIGVFETGVSRVERVLKVEETERDMVRRCSPEALRGEMAGAMGVSPVPRRVSGCWRRRS